VPQDSVLGPVLFLKYTNDMGEALTSNLLKFADDKKFLEL
jgi:hypothetical protein